MRLEFKSYNSDGPGYSGPVIFHLTGTTITQKLVGEDEDDSHFVLPQEIPSVARSRPMGYDDAQTVLDRMPEDCREHYDNDPKMLERKRVMMLEFADGTTGFIAVHGEPCYFTLVVGDRGFDFMEGSIVEYTPGKATPAAE